MDLPKIKFKTLEESVNLTSEFKKEQLRALGMQVVRDYRTDDATRTGWKQRNKEAMKLALQVVEKKDYPWPNASNVKFPLLSQAALQFNVRAYSELVRGPEIAKFRLTGKDENGQKAARAARVSKHVNYQLLQEDEGWEEGFDRLLMVLPIMGLCYRKKYWCPDKQQLVTTTVLPQNLVIPYRTESLSTTPRKTEIFEIYDRKIKERQNKKIYATVDLGPAPTVEQKDSDERDKISQDTNDTKRPREFLEQHLYLDLDGDGYEEPYVVTVDKNSSKVLRIVNKFGDIESEQTREADQLADQIKQIQRQAADMMASLSPKMTSAQAESVEAQIITFEQEINFRRAEIERLLAEEPKILSIGQIECYTKYGFIPAPDGSFYDIGFGALLGPLNHSVNTLLNQLIDSGTLNNGSQGFLGKGARIKGGTVRFKPFEWKHAQSAGQTLRESIVPLPVNQPSQVLFNLLGLLIEYTQQLSSVNDAMSGKDMGQNTPAYNMQEMLSQGLKVFSGIFKRVYRGLRAELREQFKLNRLYLNEEEYFETLDGPPDVLREDYISDEKDIYPAADPNAFSHLERAMKAQFLAQRSEQVPGYNRIEVERRLHEAMDIEDTQQVFPLDKEGNLAFPPQPDPEMQIKVAEEQRRTEESRVRATVSLMDAETNAMIKEAQATKEYALAKKAGDETVIKKYEAVTKRLAEQVKEIQAKQKEVNSETVRRPSEPRSD